MFTGRGLSTTAPRAPFKDYYSFWNKGPSVDGNLYALRSTDGVTWTTRASFNTYTPHNTAMMGCPALLQNRGKIWLAASQGVTLNWVGTAFELASSPEDNGDTFTYVSSPDFQSLVTGGSAKQIWAEPWFVDTDGTVYQFILAVPDATTSPLQCYLYIAKVDFTTSPPTYGTPVKITGTGLPTSFINPSMIRVSGVLTMFVKNDDAGQKHVEVMQSSSNDPLASGTWSMLKTGDWASWGAPLEAPVLLPNGSKWRIWLDAEGNGIYESDSVTSDPLGSWTAKTLITDPVSHTQHGSVIVNPTSH